MSEVRGYIDEAGRKRFADWFETLATPASAKVAIALTRMEQGNFSNTKGVGAGVYEYRIDFGPGYRIYFGKYGEQLQTQEETRDPLMPLTHDFKETIRARAQADPAFRQALLREAVECLINGDLSTGKAVLRDYVNATIGFQYLEKRTRIPAKSLMRMLSAKGSPSAANLSSILSALQKNENVHFTLSLSR